MVAQRHAARLLSPLSHAAGAHALRTHLARSDGRVASIKQCPLCGDASSERGCDIAWLVTDQDGR